MGASEGNGDDSVMTGCVWGGLGGPGCRARPTGTVGCGDGLGMDWEGEDWVRPPGCCYAARRASWRRPALMGCCRCSAAAFAGVHQVPGGGVSAEPGGGHLGGGGEGRAAQGAAGAPAPALRGGCGEGRGRGGCGKGRGGEGPAGRGRWARLPRPCAPGSTLACGSVGPWGHWVPGAWRLGGVWVACWAGPGGSCVGGGSTSLGGASSGVGARAARLMAQPWLAHGHQKQPVPSPLASRRHQQQHS